MGATENGQHSKGMEEAGLKPKEKSATRRTAKAVSRSLPAGPVGPAQHRACKEGVMPVIAETRAGRPRALATASTSRRHNQSL
jgi:hypothetical protein